MEGEVRELWRLVRPGGRLAITTWGPNFFAPAYHWWQRALQSIRPDLHTEFNPWDRITTVEAVTQLFRDAGISTAVVTPEEGYEPLTSPEDFWTIALGTGLRWPIDRMGPEAAERVKKAVLSEIVAQNVDRITTNVIYAVAQKPSRSA